MIELYGSYSGVRLNIRRHFDTLLDYVWKTPQLIASLTIAEQRKLDAYFPLSEALKDNRVADLRLLRLESERFKLFEAFPLYQARSNLLVAAAAFEHFLFDIAIQMETVVGPKLSDFKGNGYSRILKFMKSRGLHAHTIPLYEQVDALVTVRNCLIHVDGRLRFSRESEKIRQIISKSLYLDPSRRIGVTKDENGWLDIEVIEGDQIRINNSFAFRSCAHFRDFLLRLAQLALNLDVESPN